MKCKLEEDVNGDDNLCLLLPHKQPQPLYLNNTNNNYFHHPQVDDLFSQLPEEILVNIMSPMKLKNVVRNSIVSPSFKNACLSLRSLRFHWFNVFPYQLDVTQPCCCLDYKQKFITCVNQYLLFNRATSLRFLSIHFCLQVDDKEVIDHWLRIILSRDVECLELIFCCPSFDLSYRDTNLLREVKWYSLSGDFFVGLSKLRVARLCLGLCQFELDFLATFNSLTSLHLRRVIIKNCDIQSLLRCMPNLKKLFVRNTILPAKLSFHCLPFLKMLKLAKCYRLKEMELHSHVLCWLFLKVDRVVKVNWSALPNMMVITVDVDADGLRFILTHFPAKYPFLRRLSVFSFCDWGSCIPDFISKFRHLDFLKLLLYSDYTLDILKLIRVLQAVPCLATFNLLIGCTTEAERSEVEIGELKQQRLEEVCFRGLFCTPSLFLFISFALELVLCMPLKCE